MLLLVTVDPDFQIRGAGGGGSRSFRPLDKWGGGLKKFFFGPQFGLKIRRGEGGLGPSPGSATE